MTDEKEIYKQVKYENFGDFYYVSNFGNVKSNFNNRILSQRENNGYKYVSFSKPFNKVCSVSRLVALTFLNKPDNKDFVVNHIDENKKNNLVTNLEWVSQKENVNKSTKDKTHKKRVIQKDLNGNIIKVFDTINEAAKEVGVDRTTVSKVIVGVNQTAGGFRWEYEDSNMKPKNDVDLSDSKTLGFISEELKNYYIFKNGDIYNSSSRKYLKHCMNAKGALYVSLSKNKKKTNFYINKLVAMCYLPNPQGKTRVKHIVGNKSNNSVENLEWY